MKPCDVPLIVRIAGMPAETMASFASSLPDREVSALARCEEGLARARNELVGRLYTAVHQAPPEDRGLLLSVKRYSFNGRSLQKYRNDPRWDSLRERIGPLLDDVLALEEEALQSRQDFAAAYRQQRTRERLALAPFAADRHFLRGVALGSQVLVENLPRLVRTSPDSFGRRERQLELGLLRYASRSALKLSPFSTLTRAGLALAVDEDDATGFRLVGEETWSEESLVCFRRYLLDQYADILVHYLPVRERLRLALNDTVDSLPADHYRFLRAGQWGYDPESRELRHQKPCLVKVRLAGPLIRWLLIASSASGRTYGEILAAAAAAFPRDSPESLRGTVDQLLEIGFLRFVWPWPSDDLHLEKRMLRELETLLPDPDLEPFLAALRRSIGLMESYPDAASPADAVSEGKRAVTGILHAVAPLGGMAAEVRIKNDAGFYFHEDVLLRAGRQESRRGEVASLPLAQAQEILRNIDPLARISNLDSTRHDFLHTLAAFASERWPDQDEVGFLELFDTAHPLFQQYGRFEVASRVHGPLRAPVFNPLGLEKIDRLGEWRQRVADTMESCIDPDGDVMRLDRERIERLLDSVPGPYAASRDFCAFIQPLDTRGDRWVINSLFEGAGRLSSRYTAVMDEEMRAEWVSHFEERSVFEQDGEAVELVDLFCPAGHTLNVHAPQTRRVLEIPGESSGLSPDRRLRLSDLRIRLLGPARFPLITDASGRRVLPLHLGGLVFRYMPSLLKFLILFGPGEFRFCVPRKKPRSAGDLEIVDRHQIGNVVFRRKTWVVSAPALRSLVARLPEEEAFLALNRWRMARDIPDRLYLIEPLSEGKGKPQTKPQYVDFTSPLFVEIFRSILEMNVPTLSLVEALPLPEQYPLGRDGKHWAVEIQLDAFGFPAAANGTVPFVAQSQ
jgi:hypothetical protein